MLSILSILRKAYFLKHLLCITILLSFVDCLLLWRRGNTKLIDVNRTPSPEPDIQEAATLLVHLSSAPQQQHQDNPRIVRRKRKLSPSALEAKEEKRLKKNERQRLSRKNFREQYENRFNLPIDSQERVNIENQWEDRINRHRQTTNKSYKEFKQRMLSGIPSENDVKRWKQRLASAKAIKMKRRQRIEENRATQEDIEIVKSTSEYQKKYKKEHREQIKRHKANWRARQKAKGRDI